MNRHQQIVLFCLRDTLTEEIRSELMSMKESDWREVIKAANKLGVTPLIATNTQRHEIRVPLQISESLQKSLKNNTARNLGLLAEFQKLAKVLQARNIPLIPLKGVYLSSNLYKNIGERLISDIDLLVPFANLRDAVDAIESGTDYRPSRPYDLEAEQKRLHHLPAYIKPNAPPLEIHWTLLTPGFQTQLDLQGLWERAIPAKINGTDVLVLSPNDLLIHLCAHVAYQHMFVGALRPLYDIKLTLDRFSDRLDWVVIKRHADEWKLLNSVYLALRLTDDLLDCVIPDSAWQSLRPVDFNETLLDAARTRIFEHLDIPPTLTTVWTRQTFFQRLTGSWSRIAVPPAMLADMYKLHPKSKLVYLYYFVRAKDLFVIHGHNVINLLLGNKKQMEFALHDSELVSYLKWWDEENNKSLAR